MRERWPFYATASLLLLFLSLGAITLITKAVAQEEDQLFSDITVQMYALDPDSGAILDTEDPSCRVDDPSTPQNEADDRYGCTAFDRDHYPPDQVRPYPYAINSATVGIEGDYLLDVVPREMGPSGHHPLALRAQAIVARTYAYCAIHAWEQPGGGEGDPYWGNCLREINNSNSFQVFVPYHFDTLTSADQQAVQDAVAEVAHLIDAEETERGAIFAEFSADAYLRTAAGDYDYLRSVEDPISYDPAIPGIISATGAHQRGMSQNGANRWAWGNSSRLGGGEPWSVRWEDEREILVHYYTGVHLQDGGGYSLTPEDRWNLLTYTVASEVVAGQSYSDTLILQNTSTWDWNPYDVVLGYQWTAPDAPPTYEDWQIVAEEIALEAGDTLTTTVAVAAPAVSRVYDLHWDFARPGEGYFWFHHQWPHPVMPITVTGGATPTPTPTSTPTLTPTPTFTPTPTPSPTPTPKPTSTPGPWGEWVAAEETVMRDEPFDERQAYARLLSQVRDEVLAVDPKGEAYIRLTYRYAPEVTVILMQDEALRQRVKALAVETRPLLEDLVARRSAGGGRLQEAWVEEVLAVLEDLEQKTSPELREEIAWWRKMLPGWAGKTGREIWSSLPERETPAEPVFTGAPEEVVLRGRDGAEIRRYGRLLSRVRDEVMLRADGGEVYVALVYRYTPEVVAILWREEGLRREAEALLVKAEPALESLLDEEGGEWQFSPEWITRADRFLDALAQEGEPGLEEELVWWQKRLSGWAGKTPQEIWRELLSESRVSR